MKQAASEQFLVSLRRVLDGGIYVSEAVGNSMIKKIAAGGSYISANPVDRLSNRELQILHMIGKGMSTRETAHSLNLEHQDGRIASSARQAQAQFEHRDSTRAVCGQLVYCPRRRRQPPSGGQGSAPCRAVGRRFLRARFARGGGSYARSRSTAPPRSRRRPRRRRKRERRRGPAGRSGERRHRGPGGPPRERAGHSGDWCRPATAWSP